MATVRADLLSLYVDSDPLRYPKIGGEYVRDDTVAGRVFNGLYQQGFAQTHEELKRLLQEAQRLLGVRALPLMLGALDHSYQRYQEVLVSEWKARGYTHIFLGEDPSVETAPPSPQKPELAVLTTLDKFNFGEHDAVVRMRFDIVLPPQHLNAWFVKSRVYLMDPFSIGGQLPGGDGLPVSLPQPLLAEIQLQDFLRYSFNSEAYSGFVKLKLALWESSEAVAGFQGMNISNPISVAVKMKTQLGGLAVHNYADGTEKIKEVIAYEDAVLASVIDHFRNNLLSGSWVWTIASAFHHDADYNALDLNNSVADDYGTPLHSIAEGVITQIGAPQGGNLPEGSLALGEVKITHTVDVPGLGTKIWTERHYHLPLENRIVVDDAGEPLKNADGTIMFKIYSVVRERALIDPVGAFETFRDTYEALHTGASPLEIQDMYDAQNHIITEPILLEHGMKLSVNNLIFGYIGTTGTITRAPHDHLSLQDANSIAIDARLIMLTLANEAEKKISQKGSGRITGVVGMDHQTYYRLRWDSSIEWRNRTGQWFSDELTAVFDRSTQEAPGKAEEPQWIAWTSKSEERQRMVWDDITGTWVKAGQANPTEKWEKGAWLPQ